MLAHDGIDANRITKATFWFDPLYVASQEGHAGVVTLLLAHGVDPNGAIHDIEADHEVLCSFPLYIACTRNHIEAVKVFLADERIDVNKARTDNDVSSATALGKACFHGMVEIAKLLLAHDDIDVNVQTAGTQTPLYSAACQGHVAIIELLLAHDKIEADKPDTTNGATPLHVACYRGHVGVVKLLVAHAGFNLNAARTDNGSTPLYTACDRGHVAIAKMLLAQDEVDVNQERTLDGSTPLITAAFAGFVEVAKLLLAHGGIDASKTRYSNGEIHGESPLEAACCRPDNFAMVTLLLAHAKVDVTKGWLHGGRALVAACVTGEVKVAKLLLAHDGIDPNEGRTTDGKTALYVASEKNNVALIKLLLSQDAIDVNKAPRPYGNTPLHGAIFGGAFLATQYLLVHGANVAVENSAGLTPAEFATAFNQPELAEWLNAVSGWSQLRVAAGCRLYKDAAFLLRRGKMDPDACERAEKRTRFYKALRFCCIDVRPDPAIAIAAIRDTVAAVATASANPAALPWPNALPICKATQMLVVDATRGWHRTTHWLHHKAVREAVFAVVVVAGRLQQKAALHADESAREPLLPIELWFLAMRFFQRSWWQVEGPSTST